MTLTRVTVRIPATTANLGPGFDALALSLDLWNETEFTLAGEGVAVRVEGEGQGKLADDETNLVAQAALDFFRRQGAPAPRGLKIVCRNRLPLGSGLGSSGSAVLAGLLGANALLGEPVTREEILRRAVEIEGHPDNASAALLGGLVVIVAQGTGWLTRRWDVPAMRVAVVLPDVDLPTRAARAALPRSVSLSDAVFNLGRTALVLEALRAGDLDLLGQVMDDRLHQPYRLKLIPGASQALVAARRAGAAAAALSGAGPSLIAFGGQVEAVAEAMQAAFRTAGVASREFLLETTPRGAQILPG